MECHRRKMIGIHVRRCRRDDRIKLLLAAVHESGADPGRVKTQSVLWFPLLNRGGMMKGFVQGADRQQTTLLPECLDDWVGESNPVRAVDVFVDALELRDRHAEDADGCDALSDEDVAEGGDRDGAARPRLQPHARDEHRRYQTTSRGDPGVRSVYRCARRVTVQVAQRGPRVCPDWLQIRYSQNMLRWSRRRGSRPAACSFWKIENVFTRPGST